MNSDRTRQPVVSHRITTDTRVQPSLTDKHRVDLVERGVDLLPNLCTSENDLAANKDEEHDFGSKHAVDQTREQLIEGHGSFVSNVIEPLPTEEFHPPQARSC